MTIRKSWIKKFAGIYDYQGSDSCAVYRSRCPTNGRFYELEYEPDGLESPLPLPDYGEPCQLSGGGVRMHFDTLREAMNGAERYLATVSKQHG